jgi:hypothetical protein
MTIADQRWEDPAYRLRIAYLADQIFGRHAAPTLDEVIEYKAHITMERMSGTALHGLREEHYEKAMRRACAVELTLKLETGS